MLPLQGGLFPALPRPDVYDAELAAPTSVCFRATRRTVSSVAETGSLFHDIAQRALPSILTATVVGAAALLVTTANTCGRTEEKVVALEKEISKEVHIVRIEMNARFERLEMLLKGMQASDKTQGEKDMQG